MYHLPLWEVIDWPPGIVLALVEDLQHVPGSAFGAAVRGPEHRGWSVDSYLIANLIDITAAGGGVTEGGRKNAYKQERPGVKKKSAGTPLTALFPGRSRGGFGG